MVLVNRFKVQTLCSSQSEYKNATAQTFRTPLNTVRTNCAVFGITFIVLLIYRNILVAFSERDI